MKYYLTQEADNGSVYDRLEITETEHNILCREIRKKRANEIAQSIKKLGEIIGVAETKSMIEAVLREM